MYVFLDRKLLVPARVGRYSWARPFFPTRSVSLAWSGLLPFPIRRSMRIAPDDASLFPPRLGALMQYSTRPWKQYEFPHAMWWRRNDSASRERIPASSMSFVGAQSPYGARTLVAPRPPEGEAAGRIAVGDWAPAPTSRARRKYHAPRRLPFRREAYAASFLRIWRTFGNVYHREIYRTRTCTIDSPHRTKE